MKRGPPIRKSWDALQLRDQPDPPDPPSSFGHQALWEEIPSTPMPGINGVSAHGLIVMLASLIMLWRARVLAPAKFIPVWRCTYRTGWQPRSEPFMFVLYLIPMPCSTHRNFRGPFFFKTTSSCYVLRYLVLSPSRWHALTTLVSDRLHLKQYEYVFPNDHFFPSLFQRGLKWLG